MIGGILRTDHTIWGGVAAGAASAGAIQSVRLFTREGFYVTCNVRDADQDGGAAA